MDTITIIADTALDLVKAVLKPLGGLGEFLDSIFDVLESGSSASSELSSADAEAPAGK